jgi:hypothetical protein
MAEKSQRVETAKEREGHELAHSIPYYTIPRGAPPYPYKTWDAYDKAQSSAIADDDDNNDTHDQAKMAKRPASTSGGSTMKKSKNQRDATYWDQQFVDAADRARLPFDVTARVIDLATCITFEGDEMQHLSDTKFWRSVNEKAVKDDKGKPDDIEIILLQWLKKVSTKNWRNKKLMKYVDEHFKRIVKSYGGAKSDTDDDADPNKLQEDVEKLQSAVKRLNDDVVDIKNQGIGVENSFNDLAATQNAAVQNILDAYEAKLDGKIKAAYDEARAADDEKDAIEAKKHAEEINAKIDGAVRSTVAEYTATDEFKALVKTTTGTTALVDFVLREEVEALRGTVNKLLEKQSDTTAAPEATPVGNVQTSIDALTKNLAQLRQDFDRFRKQITTPSELKRLQQQYDKMAKLKAENEQILRDMQAKLDQAKADMIADE